LRARAERAHVRARTPQHWPHTPIATEEGPKPECRRETCRQTARSLSRAHRLVACSSTSSICQYCCRVYDKTARNLTAAGRLLRPLRGQEPVAIALEKGHAIRGVSSGGSTRGESDWIKNINMKDHMESDMEQGSERSCDGSHLRYIFHQHREDPAPVSRNHQVRIRCK
jgi:hypothetical protein